MKVELTAVTSHLRVFLDDRMSVSAKAPYDTIMTVQHLNNNRAYVSGLSGIMNAEIFREIEIELRIRGIELIEFEKGGEQRKIG